MQLDRTHDRKRQTPDELSHPSLCASSEFAGAERRGTDSRTFPWCGARRRCLNVCTAAGFAHSHLIALLLLHNARTVDAFATFHGRSTNGVPKVVGANSPTQLVAGKDLLVERQIPYIANLSGR